MSALDTAKEIGRIAAATTLGKDVIDLLEKKIVLLTEQVTALETENKNLKVKVYDLEQELSHLRPKEDLDPQAVQLLQVLARRPGLRIEEIAGYLQVSRVRAEYHRDNLMGAKMIGYHGGIVEMGYEGYELRPNGREYLATHGHI
jgi:predicted RNase H-like nuclease (RuvC/YqgF family)